MEVATVCGSSAWVLGVVGVHNWQLALFPDRAQQDVWRDDPATQISSSYAPTGEVSVVDGGYEIRGTWSFSSGCDICDWVFLGGVIVRDEGPDMRTFLVPRSDYRIDDNWHVMGLRGTGSKNIVVDAAPAVGVARGAVAGVQRAAARRVSTADGQAAVDDPSVLSRIAESGSEVAAAEQAIERPWQRMLAMAESGEPIPVSLRADCRSSLSHAVEWSMRATLRVFQVAGSRAIFEESPLQRALRDIIAMRAHAMNNVDKSGPLRARDALGVLGGEFFL
jgi:3-hydroxy-9,10-secoandrosta-1,3,5(10)-triene-9,17-dione monooxygenase